MGLEPELWTYMHTVYTPKLVLLYIIMVGRVLSQ